MLSSISIALRLLYDRRTTPYSAASPALRRRSAGSLAITFFLA